MQHFRRLSCANFYAEKPHSKKVMPFFAKDAAVHV